MWWNLHQARYAKEVEQLRRNSPGIQIFRSPVPGRYCPSCNGSPNTAAPHLAVYARICTRVGRHYPVILVYPCNFPNRIPGVWPLSALDPQPPVHQYSDGRLCLTSNEHQGNSHGQRGAGLGLRLAELLRHLEKDRHLSGKELRAPPRVRK
jgi:hypothetical protein